MRSGNLRRNHGGCVEPEAGGVRLNRQRSMLEETVRAALGACRRPPAGHPVQVHVPPDLPMLQLDAVLMERLLANLSVPRAYEEYATAMLDRCGSTCVREEVLKQRVDLLRVLVMDPV